MKENHNPGAKWKGDFDDRIYVMARRAGMTGYLRDNTFFGHLAPENTFSKSNHFTYIGGGRQPTHKEIVAVLEAQLSEARRKIERLNSDAKTSAEFSARVSAEQERQTREARDRADRAERAYKLASQAVTTMKRQIELMGEALKISQGAVVA